MLIFSLNGAINDGADVSAHKSFGLKLSPRLHSVARTRWPRLTDGPRTPVQDSSFQKTRSNSGNVNLIFRRTIRGCELRLPRFPPPLSSFPLSREIWIAVSNWHFPGGVPMPTQHKNTADGGRRIKCLRKHRSPPAVEQQSRCAASVWGHARAKHGGSKAPLDPDWRLSRQF